MIADVDLGEFKSAYLAEADELMTLARAQLAEIEQGFRAGRPFARFVRELLRALHTVKGLSGMVDVEPIVDLAHPAEALLRAVDRSEQSLKEDEIESLAQVLSAIDERLQQFAKGQAVTAPPVALLARLEPGAGTDVAEEPITRPLVLDPALEQKLAADERQMLGGQLKAGERAISVTFVPSPEKAAKGQTITTARAKFVEHGQLVRVLPQSMPVTPEAPGGLAFLMLGTTSATDAELRTALEDPLLAIAELSVAEKLGAPAPEVALPEDIETRRPGYLRVDVKKVDETIDRLGAVLVAHARLERATSALVEKGADTRKIKILLDDAARQLRELRASVLRVRMIPIGDVIEPLGLVVRDLSRKSKKPISLRIEGGEAEMDKVVAEQLFAALVHLVRNAVDHGIESIEDRRRAKKPDTAQISVVVSSRSNRTLDIRVSDDGRGIDPSRVARAAGVRALDQASLLDVLCRPGFSTREVATTTSGRGMGMDIARRTVEGQLGGELSLETEVGVGTSFLIRAPLTIAVVDTIRVRVSGEQLVIPLSTIEEIVDLGTSTITEPPQGKQAGQGARAVRLLVWRDRPTPLIDLAGLLGIQRLSGTDAQALIVRRGHDLVAFAIERAIGQRECLIRPIADPLLRVPGVSGSTDLGEGRPTLVLDLISLAARLLENERAA